MMCKSLEEFRRVRKEPTTYSSTLTVDRLMLERMMKFRCLKGLEGFRCLKGLEWFMNGRRQVEHVLTCSRV